MKAVLYKVKNLDNAGVCIFFGLKSVYSHITFIMGNGRIKVLLSYFSHWKHRKNNNIRQKSCFASSVSSFKCNGLDLGTARNDGQVLMSLKSVTVENGDCSN
jgi:hypothetical protein